MQIKWRKQEFIFINLLTILSIASRLWYVFKNHRYIDTPFRETHTPFDIYTNVIIPDLGRMLTLYAIYLFFTLYSFPRILRSDRKKPGSYIFPTLQVIVAIAILGVVLTTAEYYIYQWMFNYPGFSMFFNPDNPRSQISIGANFFFAAMALAFYILYILIREAIILSIGRSKQKTLNSSICNKVTTFCFSVLIIVIMLSFRDNTPQRHTLIIFFLLSTTLFASFITNVYWLFPAKGQESIFSSKHLLRLLGTSFVLAIPYTAFMHGEGLAAMFYSWMIQLLIVSPLTWFFYRFNKERILVLRVVESQLHQSKADLQFLRSQVNPHFLFNTLNTLYGTALQEKADRTAGGIQMLGDMMRFMLHDNNQDFIDMQKEIDYLTNYITLQKLRIQTSSNITITNNIGDQHCPHQIAPMLLIPLVENAFKHGISLNKTSWIDIHLTCEGPDIVLQVSNSIHNRASNDPEIDKSGIGLANVKARLKIIYPDKHSLSITQDEKQFTVYLSIKP